MAVKTLDEIRDELADKHLAFIGAEAHFEHRIYNAGFNAGVAEMKKRNQVLVDAANELLYAVKREKGNELVIPEFSNRDECVNIVLLALKQYKESVGE